MNALASTFTHILASSLAYTHTLASALACILRNTFAGGFVCTTLCFALFPD